METRKITRQQAGAPKANLTSSNNAFNRVSNGSFTPDLTGFAFPAAAGYDIELSRLNEIKSHFVSLAANKTNKPVFLFDKVWASAKSIFTAPKN
jgi:hypothetical protein